MVEKKIRVGFVTHSYSRGNFGLCALAFGEQAVIERACQTLGVDYEIVCFETGIHHPCNDEKVKLEEYNLRNFIMSARQFSKCDLIFDITGGDSFSDIYGIKLFLVNYFIKIAVLLSGAKYISAPQTYGPFKHSWVKVLSNFYLSKAIGIYGRDKLSGDALTIKNLERIKCVADLGFALPFLQQPKFHKLTVGFNINGLLYQDNSLLGEGGSYRELCEIIIKRCQLLGYEVVVVPHVVADTPTIDNDYFVSVDIAKKHGLKEPPFFQNPKEVKSYISQCHFFVGSRMHATIAAVSCGVPTLPLAYSRKFKGVYDSIQYPHTMDLRMNSHDEIFDKLEEMLTKGFKQATDDVTNALQIVKKKTDEYVNDIIGVIKNI